MEIGHRTIPQKSVAIQQSGQPQKRAWTGFAPRLNPFILTGEERSAPPAPPLKPPVLTSNLALLRHILFAGGLKPPEVGWTAPEGGRITPRGGGWLSGRGYALLFLEALRQRRATIQKENSCMSSGISSAQRMVALRVKGWAGLMIPTLRFP